MNSVGLYIMIRILQCLRFCYNTNLLLTSINGFNKCDVTQGPQKTRVNFYFVSELFNINSLQCSENMNMVFSFTRINQEQIPVADRPEQYIIYRILQVLILVMA